MSHTLIAQLQVGSSKINFVITVYTQCGLAKHIAGYRKQRQICACWQGGLSQS